MSNATLYGFCPIKPMKIYQHDGGFDGRTIFYYSVGEIELKRV